VLNKMNVIFLSSRGNHNGPKPIILNQGGSIAALGVPVDFFPVISNGIGGYVKTIGPLRKHIRKTRPNIIHAHYGLCGIIALLARRQEKLVVSFMGDDIVGSNRKDGSISLRSRLFGRLNAFLARKYYDFSIVKSKEMLEKGRFNAKVELIPNGVDLETMRPEDQRTARSKLNLDHGRKLIVFMADPRRAEKNFLLAEQAVSLLNDAAVDLLAVYNKPFSELVHYYNAADLLLCTSYHEGSPNIIKEAMACNCPIVSTPVGDVEWVVGDTEGCFLVSFDPADVAEKIRLALAFGARTRGRERIIEIGLDAATVAERIKGIYSRLMNSSE
jgi:teichuronic acid biosynthesis glycosyltransferase TuaC